MSVCSIPCWGGLGLCFTGQWCPLLSSSYYQQKFRDCSSEQAWTDADFLVSHKKNNNKNRKVLVYPLSSFVSAARISLMKEKEATAYLERLKGKACMPFSPIQPYISKCFIESLRLEKTSKITKSSCQFIPTMPTNHVPQCHISMVLEHLQVLHVVT